MKSLIGTLVTIVVFIASASADATESTFNLRHRDLATKVMCVDLGTQRGMHNIAIPKAKYLRKLAKYDYAWTGKCAVPTKSFKKSLLHKHDFCKVFNKDHVTIRAPEGLRKWMINEAGASDGACSTQDSFLEIFEVY